MEYYFDHPIFKLSPARQTLLVVIFSTLKILIFILGSFFLFSEFVRFKAFGALVLLIGLTQILRHHKAAHDLRFEKYRKHDKVYLKFHLTKHTFWFVLNVVRKGLMTRSADMQKTLLVHLLKEKDCQKILARLGVSWKKLKKSLSKEKTSFERTKYQFRELREIYLINLKGILQQANELAEKANYPYITTNLLFVSLVKSAHPEIKLILDKFGIDFDNIYAAFLMEVYRKRIRFRKTEQPLSRLQIFPTRKRLLNRAWTLKATPNLDRYSQDLTYLARKGEIGLLIGHQEETLRLLDVLARGLRNKALLVGEDGSGRTSIIWHLAWLIEYEKVPKELLDYRLVEINLAQLLGGERDYIHSLAQKIVNEVISAEKIILFFRELSQIILSEEGKDIITIFSSLLRSTVPIVALVDSYGLSTLENFLPAREIFEIIPVKPLSKEESITFLTLRSVFWEKEQKITISPQAISRAVSIALDFIQDKPLPKSAEDLLLSAVVRVNREGEKLVLAEKVAEAAEQSLRIPVTKPLLQEKEILINLEERMHQRIVNQEEAIKEIARVLRIYRTGVAKKSGTIGVFLFVGPTGVGKTETAKTLSKIYFPESKMLRLDMVEFQNSEDVEKLIGSEDGQIVGALTEPIRQNPYRVILLDEFEKTHPTLMKLFLPIFDEGKVKDGLGREVSFQHTILIATSNAYSEEIKDWLQEGLDFETIKKLLKDKLSQTFSIELLNRFDNIIVYKTLGENELLQIAKIMINDLREDLEIRHGFTLELTENALKEIVRLGTDSIFGARPLKRTIDQVIRGEIAKMLLQDQIKRGKKVLLDFQEKFIFQVI